MKRFVMLPVFLSVVAADISDGACGPKPPTVPEFDKEMVGVIRSGLGKLLLKCNQVAVPS